MSNVATSSNGLNYPEGLAFDSSGNLYVANYAGNSIDKITTGGTVSTFATTGLNDPYALTFDSSGNLYVTNAGNSTSEKITPTGTATTFATTAMRPSFLVIEPASVPEPSMMLLGQTLVFGVGYLRRRQVIAAIFA